jgi:hypothetical protein
VPLKPVSTPVPQAVGAPAAGSVSNQPQVGSTMASSEGSSPVQQHAASSHGAPRSHSGGSASSPARTQDGLRAAEGTLLGWFVDYRENPLGSAREIRAGKFFVGRQRLRNGDLVISDDSVSTPHSLVNASVEEGLELQDTMSEHGTFVRRAGESTWQRFYEPTVIHNGDGIKFGSYEALVCLVPSGRRA